MSNRKIVNNKTRNYLALESNFCQVRSRMPWPLDGQRRKLRWLQCPQMIVCSQKRTEEPAESALPKSFQSTKKQQKQKINFRRNKIKRFKSIFLLRHRIPSRKRNKWCRWRRQRPLDEQMARLDLLDRRFVDDGITRHHQLNWDEKQNPYLRKHRFVGTSEDVTENPLSEEFS